MTALSPLAATLNVALGGAAGAVLRYQSGRALTALIGPQAAAAFPWATLAVNVIGSMAMGLLAGWLARQGQAGGAAEHWRLLIGVGLLGGFTTFSAFSLETALMVERREWLTAAGYALGSVVLSVAALFAGLALARRFLA